MNFLEEKKVEMNSLDMYYVNTRAAIFQAICFINCKEKELCLAAAMQHGP
jgi:hypothetical protein